MRLASEFDDSSSLETAALLLFAIVAIVWTPPYYAWLRSLLTNSNSMLGRKQQVVSSGDIFQLHIFSTLATVVWIPLSIPDVSVSRALIEMNSGFESRVCKRGPSWVFARFTMLKLMQPIRSIGSGFKCSQLCLCESDIKPIVLCSFQLRPWLITAEFFYWRGSSGPWLFQWPAPSARFVPSSSYCPLPQRIF